MFLHTYMYVCMWFVLLLLYLLVLNPSAYYLMVVIDYDFFFCSGKGQKMPESITQWRDTIAPWEGPECWKG